MTSQDRIQCRGKMRVERSESVTREAYHLYDTQRALRLSTLTCACDARAYSETNSRRTVHDSLDLSLDLCRTMKSKGYPVQ